MVNLLLAAAIAAATPAVAGPPDQAQPAMFMVRDADTTIYLFGTFHALDSKTQWLNPGVRSAFENSNELVLETLIPEGRPMTISPAIFAMSRLRQSASRSHAPSRENPYQRLRAPSREARGAAAGNHRHAHDSLLGSLSSLAGHDRTLQGPWSAPAGPTGSR